MPSKMPCRVKAEPQIRARKITGIRRNPGFSVSFSLLINLSHGIDLATSRVAAVLKMGIDVLLTR